jgi:hypothetical protein
MTAGSYLLCRGMRLVAFLPIFFIFSGCSLIQIAPIQLGRVTQLETFTHTYYFGKAKSESGTPDSEVNQRIEQTFMGLLGKANWQTIKDLYGFRDIRDELVAKSIYVKGVAQFYISIDPYDHQQFLLEGTGKYFLIREKSEKSGVILLSGDFIAPTTSYKIADLNNGLLSINVILYTTRIPGEITHYNEAVVKYQIKIDTSKKDDSIYHIDYFAAHDVHLLRSKNELVTDDNKFGELIFDNSEQGFKKLLDLRGIKFLRSDY